MRVQVAELRAQVADLRAQIAALKTALTACQADNAGASAAKPRDDALAALRATESALEGGASAQEFRKYYLDARVKVDALPEAPENEPLRRIVRMYLDATTLLTASQTSLLSATEVAYFKTQYKDVGSNPLNDLPDQGFDNGRSDPPVYTDQEKLDRMELERTRELGKLRARAAAQDLFAAAKKELAAVRH